MCSAKLTLEDVKRGMRLGIDFVDDDEALAILRARAIDGDRGAIDVLADVLLIHRADSQRGSAERRFLNSAATENSRQGGNVRAAKLREARQQGTAPDSWMVPLFEEAHRYLVAKGRARIGRKALLDRAKQVAAAAGVDTDLLKLHHAQRFLDDLKSR